MPDAAISWKPSRPVAPYTSADPKSRIAEPKPPMIRYFRPASSDFARFVSRAQRMYSAIENHSSPRNSVIRLAAWTKKAMPPPAAARSA